MVPIGLLLVFLKNYALLRYDLKGGGVGGHHAVGDHGPDSLDGLEDEADLDEDREDKEEKKTLKAKLQAVQEVWGEEYLCCT